MPPEQVACAMCETANDVDADYCKKCGEPLKYACSNCGAKNWVGAEDCPTCGHDLDPIAFMTERRVKGFKSTLEEQRKMAGTLKADEEASSQRRLGKMWETEKQRQEFLAQQVAKQKKEQEIMFAAIILLAVLFVGAIVAGVIFLVFVR